MRIFIVGPDGSGKSTAARFLGGELGCGLAETGDVLVRELARLHASGQARGNWQYWSHLIHACKHDFRSELEALGDLMTRLSGACLIDECCRSARIVVGVRRVKELSAYVQKGDKDGWPSVWIKLRRGERERSGSRYELGRLPFDYEVSNDGSLKSLQENMRRIALVISQRSKAA